MARNVEIKARVADAEACAARIATVAERGPVEIVQDDTFFRCDTGRLKLRVFADRSGELIYYQRANQSAPKESFYVRTPTSDPDSLRDCLSRAYGLAGRVRKHRQLFVVGRTRIHLDDVEGLGAFIELEVVLADGEPAEAGVREAGELMKKLDIRPEQLIEEAYVDLLAREIRTSWS